MFDVDLRIALLAILQTALHGYCFRSGEGFRIFGIMPPDVLLVDGMTKVERGVVLLPDEFDVVHSCVEFSLSGLAAHGFSRPKN